MSGEHFIDLVSAHAVSFELTFRLNASEAAPILAYDGLAGDGPYWDNYQKSSQRHSVVARIRQSAPNVQVGFQYSLRSYGDNQGRSTNIVAEAVSSGLSTAKAEIAADFEYPTTTWQSIVNLPVAVGPTGSQLFDEIRGYRFAKRAEDQQLLYSVVLDLTGEGEEERISVHVAFGHEGKLPFGDFVTGAFLRAIQLASPFVRSTGGVRE